MNSNCSMKPETTDLSITPNLDFDAPPPCGRGYIPPALKRAYQSMNQLSFYDQVRCSSAYEDFNKLNRNRPPDAQYFLEDDDTEVAQAFGLEIVKKSSKPKLVNQTQLNTSSLPACKTNLKIAAFPPKNQSCML